MLVLLGVCRRAGYTMQVFEEMPLRDVFTYASMISGLSNHGKCEMAMVLFDRMEEEGVLRLIEVTSICVVSACGRMGLVDLGRELSKKMRR